MKFKATFLLFIVCMVVFSGFAFADDHGDTCSTATYMSLNTSQSGNIETGGDQDIFRVVVPSSGTLTVYTTGSTDTYGNMINSSCDAIELNDDDGDGLNFRMSRSVTAGAYYVLVQHYDYLRGSGTGAYTLHVQFAAGGGTTDDHGDTCTTATPITLSSGIGSQSGTLTAGDYDFFRVDIPSSGTLAVYTTGSTDVIGALGDSNCNAIEYDDDDGDGSNFYISRSVTAGTYYVAVLHYSSSGTGAYTLNVQFGGGGTAKVGVEWTSSSCTYCRTDSEGFYNTMISNGSIGGFNNGGDAARASHFTNEDASYVDAVDMVYFSGHGGTSSDTAKIGFDYPVGSVAKSIDMRLGDGDLKWLVLSACKTLEHSGTVNVVNNWSNSFRGLHMILGFHTYSIDSWTTAEIGEDFADALNDGETVCGAWMDASWDWIASTPRLNKPACLSAENHDTDTLDNDHFLGKGITVSDPYPFQYLALRYVQ